MLRSTDTFRLRAAAALFVLAAVLASTGPAAASAAPADREPSIREARFIFRGTIEALGASNLALLAASGETALVRVGQVIDQPPAMARSEGTVVTVVLANAEGAAAGQRAIFFTNPWLFGEHVAVLERDRIADPADPRAIDQLRQQVAAVRATVADEALAAHLSGASLVVAGRVGVTLPVAAEPDEREHAAEWVRAELAVDSVEKGQPGKTATVYFAGADEELWSEAPKLRSRQAGLFLLQPYAGDGLPAGALVLLDPLDALPLSQLDRIRRLLHLAAGPRR